MPCVRHALIFVLQYSWLCHTVSDMLFVLDLYSICRLSHTVSDVSVAGSDPVVSEAGSYAVTLELVQKCQTVELMQV